MARTIERTEREVVALGVFRKKANERGRHLQLNPSRKEYLELQPGDRLVVSDLVTPVPGMALDVMAERTGTTEGEEGNG